MFFILGGLGILVVSFVIALVSMVRERGRVSREAALQPHLEKEAVETGHTSQLMAPDIAKKPDGVQTQTPVGKTEPFPWIKGGQPSGILHPKHTTTIGIGLRTNLNNSVSIRDLKKKS